MHHVGDQPKWILYKLFSLEGERERKKDGIMNWISHFCFAITNALYIYRRPAKFLAFLQTVEQISCYCLSGQHSYTRGPLAVTNALSSESPVFKYNAEGQLSRITLWHCLFTLLNTSTQLSFWHLQFITSYRTHSDLMSTLRIK